MGFRNGSDSDGIGVTIPPRVAFALSGVLMFMAFAIVGVSFGRWLHR